MAALLDVNALIALLDMDHTSHHLMESWFLQHHGEGWATTPITENGFVRILSQPAYPSGQRTPAEAVHSLAALKRAFPDTYQFWPEEISLLDPARFHHELIAGTRQVTDIYLLGLALSRQGTFVSFDRTIAWHAVAGGSEQLVQRPA